MIPLVKVVVNKLADRAAQRVFPDEDEPLDAGLLKALFMTVWRPSTRSAENSCGIRQG